MHRFLIALKIKIHASRMYMYMYILGSSLSLSLCVQHMIHVLPSHVYLTGTSLSDSSSSAQLSIRTCSNYTTPHMTNLLPSLCPKILTHFAIHLRMESGTRLLVTVTDSTHIHVHTVLLHVSVCSAAMR